MANWISSKLKAAESILQQIDQQAAGSLGKAEKALTDDGLGIESPTRGSDIVSLKDQLKKKPHESNNVNRGQSQSNQRHSFGSVNTDHIRNEPESPKPAPTVKTTLTDSDWTQLLGTPSQPATSVIQGIRKNGKKQSVALVSTLSEAKRNQKANSSASKSVAKIGKAINGKASEVKNVKARDLNNDVKPNDKGNEGIGGCSGLVKASSVNGESSAKVDQVSENKSKAVAVREKHEPGNVASEELKKGSSSVSYGSSDSDSDSGSSSDSEAELEREERRKRREKIRAEKAAARAVEAIKERENKVARLEGEKESLEKILEEQTKQQVQEASKLQTSMMETMEAVDLEKQKHNTTRMEVLTRLAKLETMNAELARSLATMQWNLEVEVNQVAEIRQQIDLKEVQHEELRRKITDTHHSCASVKKATALKGTELEREILAAEYAFVTDEIGKLQDKAKKLESDTERMRKEMEQPTEVEVELKRRLNQMTDHLIQKQAQVESLSSEKATILFRIEAITRMLDDNNSMMMSSSGDLESGKWELPDSKLKPLFEDKIRSSRKHLYSLLQQFDAIFVAGAVFLRRNPAAKLWSLVYLVCLHLWVIYILTSHSQPSSESKSGAVFSLENIGNTSNI